MATVLVRSLAAVAAALATVAAVVAWPGVPTHRVITESTPNGPAATTTTRPPQLSPAEAERAFDVALNLRRKKLGLPPLANDPALTTIARNWAAHMAATEKLAHNPNLTSQAPAGWYKVGENVGVGTSVAAIHVAFLRSPEHYRNIVDPGFDRVGIGVVVQEHIIWVAVDFEQPAGPAKKS